MPKLCSLSETLEELKTDICVLTETWIKEDQNMREQLEDFENLSGFSMIRKDREGEEEAAWQSASTLKLSP